MAPRKRTAQEIAQGKKAPAKPAAKAPAPAAPAEKLAAGKRNRGGRTPVGTQKRRPATGMAKKRARQGKSARHPTTAQIVARNLQIVRMYEVDYKTFTTIAAALEIDEKTAREGYRMYSEEIAPLLVGGEEMLKVGEFIRKLEGAQERFAEMLNDEKVAVENQMKALRNLIETMWREIELRQAVGLLPKNLGTIKVDLKVRWVMEQVFTVLKKYDMPEEAFVELQTILRSQRPPAEAIGSN